MNLYISGFFSYTKIGGGYYVRNLTVDQYMCIEKSDAIYVYGAGTIARELAGILDQMGKRILAYIVSDYTSQNPQTIYGVPVVKLGKLDNKNENACVIIATIPRYHKEIKALLAENGFTNILTIA